MKAPAAVFHKVFLDLCQTVEVNLFMSGFNNENEENASVGLKDFFLTNICVHDAGHEGVWCCSVAAEDPSYTWRYHGRCGSCPGKENYVLMCQCMRSILDQAASQPSCSCLLDVTPHSAAGISH